MTNVMNNKKGIALPIVIGIMVVVIILVTSLLHVSLAETKIATRQERKTQAHYLGRSGINVGLEVLQSKVPYDNDISDLLMDLNAWASLVSATEEFTLAFELIGPREIKIISEGKVSGNQEITDNVTLRVRMLTSLLTGGKAQDWYVSQNSHNLIKSNDPAMGGHTYLGQGVFFEGKSNSPTHFPSNAPGDSIFQASVIQFLNDSNNVSLSYSGQTQDTIFDAEIIIFNGRIVMGDTLDVRLRISDVVAKNKIIDADSILYVDDSIVRNNITSDGHTDGVGFENEDYYNYFIGGSYVNYNDYGFQTEESSYARYGVVYFGEKVVNANNPNQSDSAQDKLPYYNPEIYATGYFFYPDNININLNTIQLRELIIPIRKDDPIVSLIEVITKVTIKSQPYIWDSK